MPNLVAIVQDQVDWTMEVTRSSAKSMIQELPIAVPKAYGYLRMDADRTCWALKISEKGQVVYSIEKATHDELVKKLMSVTKDVMLLMSCHEYSRFMQWVAPRTEFEVIRSGLARP